jgi:hypothetical protein
MQPAVALRLTEGWGVRSSLRSEEAQIGKRVRVRKDHRKANLRGLEGTIAKRWGNQAYPALDVLLDEGYLQLFWYHELEEIGAARGSKRLRFRKRQSIGQVPYS